MRIARFAVLVAVLVPAASPAQPAGPATDARAIAVSHASRAREPLRTDGRLDEPDWAAVASTNSFTQIDPAEGKPASQPTEVRVLYDDDYLFVGVRLSDSGRITARLGRRDMDPGDSDWFRVLIDSYHDHRTAFGFEVNPVGVRRDEIRTVDVDDNSWDPVWDAATRVDSAGWTAELRIPFSQLRFSASRLQTWGIQLERVIGRTQEYAVSTFIPKSERGGVPLYGHLDGLEGIRPGKRLELLPYSLARSSFVDPGVNPFRANPDQSAAAGLDLLYRVTSSLTLNAAINPDFGQVEVDPAVVNLGVYETFFQEKRPFFIEGSEIFDFGAAGTSGGQIFYSRRIGRAPSLFPPVDASDTPDATTILGAGKLSGKPGGWSVGALEAVTDKEEARYRTATVPDGKYPVEPLSNYFVGRARREWRGGQSTFGGIVTAVNRDLASDPLRAALHSSAYAGGVDFRHEWAKRTWAVYGDAELSRVQGSSQAILATQGRSNHFFQRPDADHLEVDSAATSLTGYSINLQASKQSGQHWRGSFGTAFTSPKYEVNDLGFSYRTDRRDFQTSLTYLQNKPGKMWRRWNVTGSGRLERNYDWQSILSYAALSSYAQTPGYWSVQPAVTRFFRAHDDRLTRGGPLATRPAWWSGGITAASDVRKPLVGSLNLSGDRYESGGWDWSTGINLTIQKSTRWNLTLGPAVSHVHSMAQWVTTLADSTYIPTYGRRYIFAPLEQTSVGLETRLNVTFTPSLSLETYVQPLLSSADYRDPKQLVAPNTYDFAPYSKPVRNRDFNQRTLRGNAVLRWEWRRGSTIYVAWQQRRTDLAGLGDFGLDRDSRALFETRPDNIYLVKVNYWFAP
ncbi:MAG TPA: DUF5916 domain-containing protein [Candidatus Eisenbacteria bacterium]